VSGTGVGHRLRARRATWWCILFLAAVGVASLAAPLLPLPSPSALALQDEPAPPVPPWREFARRGSIRKETFACA